jgi:hypothetical protein
MPTFFMVDRRWIIAQPGQTLELTKYADVMPPELQADLTHMFPAGLSRHGHDHFLHSG